MKDMTERTTPLLDIWPYAEAVPKDHLSGHQVWGGFVEYVYRSGDDRFELVHVRTKPPNVFLVIAVDRLNAQVYGHHLLNLNKQYGLNTPSPDPGGIAAGSQG